MPCLMQREVLRHSKSIECPTLWVPVENKGRPADEHERHTDVDVEDVPLDVSRRSGRHIDVGSFARSGLRADRVNSLADQLAGRAAESFPYRSVAATKPRTKTSGM